MKINEYGAGPGKKYRGGRGENHEEDLVFSAVSEVSAVIILMFFSRLLKIFLVCVNYYYVKFKRQNS
jgi:hypothetical protein